MVIEAQKGDFFIQHNTGYKFEIIEKTEDYFSLWNITKNCEANSHFYKSWLITESFTLLINEYDLWI